MPNTTEDLIDEYMDEGMTADEAYDAAMNFIAVKAKERRQQMENLECLDSDDEDCEDDEPETKEEKYKRIFNIGCGFKGVTEIGEYEDNEIYIPSSYYCLIKCVEKHLGMNFDKTGLNPYGDSLKKLRDYLRENEKLIGAEFNIYPSIFKKCKTKGRKFITIDKKAQNICGACILLMDMKKGNYHAVLIKSNNITLNHYNSIMDHTVIQQNKKLEEEYTKLVLPKFKMAEPSFYVFDIETSSKNIDGNRLQIPEGLAFMKNYRGTPCLRDHVQTCVGTDCFEQMFDHISQHDGAEIIKIFAHNGGCFDNIFVKGIEGVTILDQIKNGGRLKQLKISYNDKIFIFLDSYAFLQASLSKCCEYFGTEKKADFDIINKSHKWFAENTDWIPYMEQDVYVLGQIMEKFEHYLSLFGESVTTSIGIPGVAWKLLCKNCHGLSKMYIAKDPVTRRFIKEACYGGRIMHYQKKFIAGVTHKSRGLICLDGNSLFPSGMFIGKYPIGKHKILPKMNVFQLVDRYLDRGLLCLAEVEIDACNSRYPLIPYRTQQGNLIYRAGKFTGVYTSVDLLEAINDGMKITKFVRGLYWSQSGCIFKTLIKKLYDDRIKFKKEGNPMEYVYKILLNSSYGKFLEEIDTFFKFNDDNIKSTDNIRESVELKNGQTEYTIKHDYSIVKKPSQIAAFILSYSRKIMNNIIRKVGPQNIFYGDTDSIYCTIESFEIIKGETNSDLCGFKNDYGEGILITQAYFLDLKRYYLEFNRPIKDENGLDIMFKAKFNGLNFRDKNALKNWTGDGDKKTIKKLYEWFHDHPQEICDKSIIQEKWSRLHDSVQISDKELKFQINPDLRNEWVENISYPLYFNHENKSIKLGKHTTFEKARNIDYSLSQYGLKSCLPLVCEGIQGNIVSVPPKVMYDDFKNSFQVDRNGNKYLRTIRRNPNYGNGDDRVTIEETYEINDYGPIRMKKPKTKCNELVAIKDAKNKFPRITAEEFGGVRDTIMEFARPQPKK